jgi:TonB family protein
VVVSFVIDSSGGFKRVMVVSSSGSDLLDRAAVAAVNALSRRIPRPKQTGVLALPLRTAIRFEIPR